MQTIGKTCYQPKLTPNCPEARNSLSAFLRGVNEVVKILWKIPWKDKQLGYHV